jgi:hypothetical protein
MYVSGRGRTVDYREAITLEDQEGKTLLTLHVPRNGSISTARRMSSTRARRRCSLGSACYRAPGHTGGHQVVVVEIDGGTNVLGGVLALGAPTWLSHAPGPEIPERRPWATDRAST